MKRLLHDGWPVLAVLLFAAFLAAQIPVASLTAKPSEEPPPAPAAAFVTFDDRAYARVVRRLRMSWQVGGRTLLSGRSDSRTGVFDFSAPLPPPSFLPAPPLTDYPLPDPATVESSALLPPTLGRLVPAFSVPPARPERNRDLLDWPFGLDR